MARFMILTKRRLILYSVAIVTLFFLFKVTTSFLDDSPTQSSFETKQTMRQLLDEADRGSVEAYYRLGRLFEQGLETPQDLVRAHAWYTLAAGQGMLEASMARDALAHEMTLDELTEAYGLAMELASGGGTEKSVSSAEPRSIPGTLHEDADAARPDGDAEMVSNQLAANLDPDALDKQGGTLLNRAVEGGNLAVIEAVLDAGAEVNTPGKDGRRPLGIAVAAGREDVVALLIERGADPTLVDVGGMLVSEPAAGSGKSADPVRMGTDTGTSKPEQEPDDFNTAAGREEAAVANTLDTASREKIARDLLGATVGDGVPVPVTTPEQAPEPRQASVSEDVLAPKQVLAPPRVVEPKEVVEPERTLETASLQPEMPAPVAPVERTDDRAVAPPVAPPIPLNIQTARIKPEDPATARAPSLEPGRMTTDGTWSPPAPETRVRTAQYLLHRLGYDPGPADGREGSRTLAAVRAYQKDKGERADGRITQALVDRLDAEVVAEEARRLAAIENGGEQRTGRPEIRREEKDIWVKILGSAQKFVGYDFNSIEDPDEMSRYCSKNGDNWIYDFGTQKFVLCREFLERTSAPSR
jgi:hypothetical protein